MEEGSEIIKETVVMVVEVAEVAEVVVVVVEVEAAEEDAKVDLMVDKEEADSVVNKEVEIDLVVVTAHQDLQDKVVLRIEQKKSKREEDEWKLHIDWNEYFYLLFIR